MMDYPVFEDPRNSWPLDDFLGLTPKQMHTILYAPLDEMQEIVCFESSFDRSLLVEVPVVKRVELLIKMIGEAGEAKATQNGNLPKKIVNALCDFGDFPKRTVTTEELAPEILALRYAVIDRGWLKKRTGRFSLTKKGQQIFEHGFQPSDYVVLLKYWMREYDWAFTDRYPQLRVIQESVVFMLFVLMKRAQEPFVAELFTELFARAFPVVMEELAEEPNPLEQSLEDKLGRVIRLRFLERFAAYFGLIDYKLDKQIPWLEREKKAQVKTTELFVKVFTWFSADKQRINIDGNDLLH